MEDRDIAVLIHGKSEPFREKILSNVSRNRRKIILDEEEFSADTISKADSERITSAVFATLRRAWEKGDLIVYNRDEIYV
jgi:flagellar motor switch protein FliG